MLIVNLFSPSILIVLRLVDRFGLVLELDIDLNVMGPWFLNNSGSITLRTHLMKIIYHKNSSYFSYNLFKHHWTLNIWYSMLFNVLFLLFKLKYLTFQASGCRLKPFWTFLETIERHWILFNAFNIPLKHHLMVLFKLIKNQCNF